MNTIGIYLRYSPTEPLKDQGISRLLSFLISGCLSNKSLHLTIAIPSWLKHQINELLTEQNIDTSKIEFITTGNKPILMRLLHWKQHRTKFSLKILSLPYWKDLLKKALKHLLSRMGTLLFVPLFLIYTIAFICLLPLVPLLSLVYLTKSLIVRLGTRVSSFIKTQLDKSFLSPQKLKRFFESTMIEETTQLIDKINTRNDVDVWFVPTLFWDEIKLIQKKVVIAVPDVVFVDFPTQFNDLFCYNVYKKMQETSSNADAIICYSNHVKTIHIIEALGFEEDKISVIPHGHIDLSSHLLSSHETNPTPSLLRNRALSIIQEYQNNHAEIGVYMRDFDFSELSYVFYSSQLRHHKNFMNLIKAVRHLIKERNLKIKLIVTANIYMNDAIAEYIANNKLMYDIISLHNVPTKVLAALNCLSICAVNPTLFEGGFPFTFSEAFSVGTPSVMSAIPAVLEQVEDTQLRKTMLFDPYDVTAIADKIEWAIKNCEKLYAAQLPLYQTLKERTWDEVAKDYLAAFNNATTVV